MHKQINPTLFCLMIIFWLFKPLVMASDVQRFPELAYRWKIRGKTATAWLDVVSPVEKIFLTPIQGRIDTIFYQKKIEADTTKWQYYLTRISVEGNYVGDVGACCLNLQIYPLKGRPSGAMEVQFRLTTTDNKLYLGQLGNNGVILKQGETISLEEPCHNSPVGNRILYPFISIEEIDTSEAVVQALIDNQTEENQNTSIKGDPELRTLVCINSAWFDSSGYDTYSYCSKRTIIEFSFIPLDKKPLIVEFDAKTQKVFLR